jgi:hypothetical protein
MKCKSASTTGVVFSVQGTVTIANAFSSIANAFSSIQSLRFSKFALTGYMFTAVHSGRVSALVQSSHLVNVRTFPTLVQNIISFTVVSRLGSSFVLCNVYAVFCVGKTEASSTLIVSHQLARIHVVNALARLDV